MDREEYYDIEEELGPFFLKLLNLPEKEMLSYELRLALAERLHEIDLQLPVNSIINAAEEMGYIEFLDNGKIKILI